MKIINLVIKHLPTVCRFNELYKAVEFIYSCIQMQMTNPGKEVGGELRATREMLLVQSDRDERYVYETESEIGKNSLKASL